MLAVKSRRATFLRHRVSTEVFIPNLIYTRRFPGPTVSNSRCAMSLLNVSDTKIVDEQGREVILRVAGLGGWMKLVYQPVPSDVL